MKIRSCLTLFFLLLASLPHAQTWTNLGIGGGGAQFAPSYSPLDSNLLFLQCDMGGIYRSTNNGANFTMVDFMQFGSQTDYPNGSCPIAYDPNNVNNLWAFGVQKDDVSGSLLKSTDEGLTWSYATQPPSGSWSRINCIVLDRGDSNFMILGTDTGAYFSTNGGTSWSTCPTVSGYVWGIVIDQSSTTGNRTSYIGSSAGVFKSTNEGAAWAAADSGLPAATLTGFTGASTPSTIVLYAVYDPTGSGTGNGTDLYRSTNGAASWTLAQVGTVTDGFNKVECSESYPATAYALNNSSANTEGVWKTTDYGATWNNVFNPVKGGGNVTLGWCDWDITFQEGAPWIQLKVDPANPNQVTATDLDTTYLTTDGGITWNEIYSTFADANPIAAGKKWASRGLEVTTAWHYYINPWSPATHYIAQSDIGLQRSTDSGSTWYHSISFSTPWHNTIYEMVFDAGTSTIYAAASNQHDIPHSTQIGRTPSTGGVLKSTDNGANWAPVTTGLPGTPATSILRDGSGNMYVALWGNSAANGGVFKSTNNGASWTAVNTGLGNGANFHAYQLKMDSSGNLYCLISGYDVGGPWVAGGIWKFPNGGSSWTYLTANGDGTGVPLYYLQGFDMDSSGMTIYAASMKWGSPSQKGMYRSVDGGANWTHAVTQFTGTVNPIDGFSPSVDPTNSAHLYLGTENEGLWESFDTGNTWSRVTGVPFRNTHRVFFDAATGDRYLTTFGSSVWKLPGVTPTMTPTTGATNTPTPTATKTPTSSPSNSPTNSPTKTPTNSPTNSSTLTPTNTPTNTSIAANTSTYTWTFTPTPSLTFTNTPTGPSCSPTVMICDWCIQSGTGQDNFGNGLGVGVYVLPWTKVINFGSWISNNPAGSNATTQFTDYLTWTLNSNIDPATSVYTFFLASYGDAVTVVINGAATIGGLSAGATCNPCTTNFSGTFSSAGFVCGPNRVDFIVTNSGSTTTALSYSISSDNNYLNPACGVCSGVYPTATPFLTFTPTMTPTGTLLPTNTYTSTSTPTPSRTPTFTFTPSATPSPTFTASSTGTSTWTPTPSFTLTPTYSPTPASSPVLRVACVGDSLTLGYPGSLTQSYPTVLNGLLGANYQVQNDGLFGATLSQSTTISYWGSAPFNASQIFQPNIVVICLGTNDLQTGNWPGNASFASYLVALINLYQGLASHPTVYVCLPPWISQNFWGATDALLTGAEIPLILQTVQQTDTCVIDLHSGTVNHPEYYADAVHMNSTGYTVMANKVDCVLTGSCPCGGPTPTFTPGTGPVGTPEPFPNPVKDPGPVSVLISLGQPAANLSLSVFTTALRKVNQVDFTNLPPGGVVLPLPTQDKTGAPLANGLYYLVAKTSQGRSIGKLLVLR